MKLYPHDLPHLLEFDKLINIVKGYALGDSGRDFFDDIRFTTQTEVLRKGLDEVREYKALLEENIRFPIAAYPETAEEIRMLAIEDYTLSDNGVHRIACMMRVSRDIFRWFRARANARNQFPALWSIVSDITFDDDLLAAIERIIDAEGNIRPDASPEIMRIRRAMTATMKEIDREFRSLVNKYAGKGWLADTVETIRNGRRVLAVNATHKRDLRGIIHDESESGKTTYIEPEEIIERNNELFDLYQEERREIWRIMRDLSERLRPSVNYIRIYRDLLVRFDVIQCKGSFAYAINAIMPEIKPEPFFNLRNAVHPLLYLKNRREAKETIRFDFSLLHQNRILLISGPNAGGKSVTLKAVCLLQMMLQAGFLIPVEEGSQIGIFDQIFADIGDRQSWEDELSTYSSRLRDAQYFIEHATPQTLVLIDEFGSGTDPKAGGVIAESILHTLVQQQVWGIITTHYSNLKMYAFRNKGVVNGAMIFDKNTLMPTYRLMIGKPGSSYAFEIAKKIGLDKDVIEYAARRMGEAEKNLDELLIELQQEKQETLENKVALLEERVKLDTLTKYYESLNHQLEIQRKKQSLTKKEKDVQEVQTARKDLHKLIRELSESVNREKALEKAQQLLAEQDNELKEISTEVETIQETLDIRIEKSREKALQPGMQVRLGESGTRGLLETLEKNEAVVLIGNMRLKVKPTELLPVEVEAPTYQQSYKLDSAAPHSVFDAKIDIRGMNHEEALHTIEDFLDRALISNSNVLRIVHGKGGGFLRNIVRVKLREYRDVSKFYHPADEQGGDGVTIVELS